MDIPSAYVIEIGFRPSKQEKNYSIHGRSTFTPYVPFVSAWVGFTRFTSHMPNIFLSSSICVHPNLINPLIYNEIYNDFIRILYEFTLYLIPIPFKTNFRIQIFEYRVL